MKKNIHNSFDSLATDFISSTISSSEQTKLRPGSRLVKNLSLPFVCVGLGYRDGVVASRFLQCIDTRSAKEMKNWDSDLVEMWLRHNYGMLLPAIRQELTLKYGDGWRKEFSSDAISLVSNSIDWRKVGIWGPGMIGSKTRLRRLQEMFIVDHIVSDSSGEGASLGFMTGHNRSLGGTSPLLFMASSHISAKQFERLLEATADYIGLAI